LFLALTEATFGVNNPTIWGRATAARDTGDLGDGITNHQYGGPRKNCSIENAVRQWNWWIFQPETHGFYRGVTQVSLSYSTGPAE
jgi:hypothetical protein